MNEKEERRLHEKSIKEQLTRCLNCKVANDFIADYKYFFKILSKNSKDINEKDIEMIKKLSSYLNIKSTTKKQFIALRKICEHNSLKNSNNICLYYMNTIMFAINWFYEDNKSSNHTWAIDNKKHLIPVFTIMNDVNKNIQHYDYSRGKTAISNLKKISIKNSEEEEEEELFDELKYIFDAFTNEKEENYTYLKKGDCYMDLFNYNVGLMTHSYNEENEYNATLNELYNRIDKLSNKSQEIIKEYIKYAPKKFGYNLQAVMKHQNMTENDLKVLTGIEISAIQALTKADVPQRNQKDIENLCRALLVSKEVLYNGIGKIYGNWKLLLDNDGIQTIASLIDGRNKTSTKEFVRTNIRDIISLPEAEFIKLIHSTPDLFCESSFNIENAFTNLLNKKEAYTLLEVLEKVESK